MPDPVTVGALVAMALGLGSEAAKTAMSESVKDAYRALKTKVSTWAAGDVAELEKMPTSAKRQDIIAETVDGLIPYEKEALKALAQELLDRLEKANTAVGLDIGRLRALNVALGNIDVTMGIGVKIENADVPGTFSTGDISVGKR